jgi:signal transduction histidine kinase
VEKLGGEVDVKSDGVPGQGSVFSFTLPPSTQI